MTLLSYEPRATTAARRGGGFSPYQTTVIVLATIGLFGYAFALGIDVTDPERRHVAPLLRPLLILLVAAALAVPSAVRRVAGRALDWLRGPSASGRRAAALALWLIASLYCWYTAVRQGRDLEVRSQDEMMFLVQTHQVASGHLYLPAHPMGDFFQTFYIFVRPVYAGMYFPGTAIMFAPIAWFGIPCWAWALVIAGGVVALTFRVVAELTDNVIGGLAALLLLSLSGFRALSVMSLSYLPMALLTLGVAWAYLHWRRGRRLGWAVVTGALLGWAAITRPLDALCFGLFFGLAILWDLRGAGWRRGVLNLAVVTACAAPFLALQLVANHGITGQWGRTPVQHYFKTFWPGVDIGGLSPPRLRETNEPVPAWAPPMFRANYNQFLIPIIQRNDESRSVESRYTQTLSGGLPAGILAAMIPVGLLGLRDPRRWAWVGGLLVFPAAYLIFFFTRHYAVIVAPPLICLALLGVHEIQAAFPRARRFLATWLTLGIGALAVANLPEVSGGVDAPARESTIQKFNEAAKTIEAPAVVLFHSPDAPRWLWKVAQLHNYESARIDDARIVRAHDLGDRNPELFDYYAKLQPDRTFYVFDQHDWTLTKLGKARDLAKTHPATRPAPHPTPP